MNKVKYIVTSDGQMIVFPEYYTHSDMAKGFDGVVSAGFLSFNIENGMITCSCYGNSVSLGLKSWPERDNMIARQQILQQID